jgi:hypothetical protein
VALRIVARNIGTVFAMAARHTNLKELELTQMLELKQGLCTIVNVYRLRAPWRLLLTQLDSTRKLVGASSFPYDVHKWAMLGKGELAGFFFDLAQPCADPQARGLVTLLSAEIQTIIAGADEYIDNVLRSKSDREIVIQSLWHVLRSGRLSKSSMPDEVRSLYPFCVHVSERMATCPNPEPFWRECELLVEAAIEQVRGDGSIEVVKRMGAHAIGVSAVLPRCFGAPRCDKLMEAGYALGGYFNLLDDLRDIREDRVQEIVTPLSVSADLAAAIDTVKIAMDHCRDSYENALDDRELRKVNVLASMLNVVWLWERVKNVQGWNSIWEVDVYHRS